MNRLEYDKERGILLEENLYEQSQTEIKQLLMKLFAVSSIYRTFGCPEQLQPTKPPIVEAVMGLSKQWEGNGSFRSLNCDGTIMKLGLRAPFVSIAYVLRQNRSKLSVFLCSMSTRVELMTSTQKKCYDFIGFFSCHVKPTVISEQWKSVNSCLMPIR
jgi:hypothetical protein